MIISSFIPAIKVNVNFTDIGEEDNAVLRISAQPKTSLRYVLHFIVDGKGYFQSDEIEKTELSAGDAFVVYKNSTSLYYSNKTQPLHYFWIGFDEDESENILSYIGFSKKFPVLSFNNATKIADSFSILFEDYKSTDNFRFLSSFYELMHTLKINNTTLQENTPNENDIFFKAIEYMKINLDKNLKVKDLANYLYIDRSYFSKIFKEKYKVSPYQYYMQLKISKAEFLVKTTCYSLSEISNMLGFTNNFMFSKTFKQYYGVVPSSLRKHLSPHQ